MIEILFILIGIGITITVLLLPSYTPEQVGSKKLIARRKQDGMDTENEVQKLRESVYSEPTD